jgi:predicted AlkP superfamily pyrophosphatase or phosphodiesterase
MTNRQPGAVGLACVSAAFALAAAIPLPTNAGQVGRASDEERTDHVLLISVDGMHEADLRRYLADPKHTNSAFARLAKHGVHYLRASSARPSDSFPGLMAFMTGGSPKSTGVFYDDSYERTLFAPGSNCQGAPGAEAQFAENLDYDLNQLSGGDTTPDHINPANLPMRRVDGKCEPVYPHNFLKVNTIMEVIHSAGKRTAWSDKHPAYEIVGGPSGKGLDELFAPEINSTTVQAFIPSASASDDWTTKPEYTRVYDQFKVAAVLNQIRGLDHTGAKWVGVPAIFGMNFQAVSVGQKVTVDGYLAADATPSAQLAASLDFVDASLASLLDTLEDEGLLDRTVVIVGAKHGQSPIDVTTLHMLQGTTNPKVAIANRDVTDPADLLAAGRVELAQETADDISLLWLADQRQLSSALAILEADQAGRNTARIQTIFAGESLVSRFGNPKLGRAPDIIIQPIAGTIYSKSARKISEHGGFVEEDTHTLLIVSSPRLEHRQVDDAVTNMQVAPTILRLLGLKPQALEAVRLEGTKVLPGLDLDN